MQGGNVSNNSLERRFAAHMPHFLIGLFSHQHHEAQQLALLQSPQSLLRTKSFLVSTLVRTQDLHERIGLLRQLQELHSRQIRELTGKSLTLAKAKKNFLHSIHAQQHDSTHFAPSSGAVREAHLLAQPWFDLSSLDHALHTDSLTPHDLFMLFGAAHDAVHATRLQHTLDKVHHVHALASRVSNGETLLKTSVFLHKSFQDELASLGLLLHQDIHTWHQ